MSQFKVFAKVITFFYKTLIPQICSLRKVKMCVNIGVAQEKATQT